jgi:hypothetical protein
MAGEIEGAIVFSAGCVYGLLGRSILNEWLKENQHRPLAKDLINSTSSKKNPHDLNFSLVDLVKDQIGPKPLDRSLV